MNAHLAQSSVLGLGLSQGALVGLALFLGVTVLAPISIFKAVRQRTAGWIIVAAISVVLLVMALIDIIGGVVSSIGSGERPLETTSSKAAPSQTVRGEALAYTLQVPSNWTVERGVSHFDTRAKFKSFVVGVIAEPSNLGTPKSLADLAARKLKDSATNVRCSDSTLLVIDGRNWLEFTADCRIKDVPLSYQFYVYGGQEGTYQLVGWTTQDLFKRDAPAMRDAMQTFRFPE